MISGKDKIAVKSLPFGKGGDHRRRWMDIVDFYCHSARLFFEPDGSQHYEEKDLQKDRIRTERIEKRNLTVIRIPNNEITGNFEGVCDYIDNTVKESLRQSATDTSLWARETMIIGGLLRCKFIIHKNNGI